MYPKISFPNIEKSSFVTFTFRDPYFRTFTVIHQTLQEVRMSDLSSLEWSQLLFLVV